MCGKHHFHRPCVLCRAGAVPTPLAAPGPRSRRCSRPQTAATLHASFLVPGWVASLEHNTFSPPGSMLVAHTVKNLPAMQETKVGSLGWKNPLKRGMATHSSISAWRIPQTEATVHGVQRVRQDSATNTFHVLMNLGALNYPGGRILFQLKITWLSQELGPIILGAIYSSSFIYFKDLLLFLTNCHHHCL